VKFSGYIALNRILLVGAKALFRRAGPQPLALPQDRRQLAKWLQEEASTRERLDAAVLEWLNRRRWPADLDDMDRRFLTERLFYAIHWLRAAHVLPKEMRPDTHPNLLEALLIDVWHHVFLGEYEGRLQHLIHLYQDGLPDSRVSSFSA
jgi:hypothetical protein